MCVNALVAKHTWTGCGFRATFFSIGLIGEETYLPTYCTMDNAGPDRAICNIVGCCNFTEVKLGRSLRCIQFYWLFLENSMTLVKKKSAPFGP